MAYTVNPPLATGVDSGNTGQDIKCNYTRCCILCATIKGKNMALENIMQLGQEYLAKRGISEELRLRLGISVQGFQGCLAALNRVGQEQWERPGGLVIPVTSNYNVVTWLGDATENMAYRGKKTKTAPKCLSPSGKVQCYVPPNWDQDKDHTVVYVCESHVKAAVMCEAGYLAICGPGCWGLQRAGELIDLPACVGAEGVEVCMLPDSDWATNPKVMKSVKTTMQLLELKYPGTEVTEKLLPHGPGGKKWGIDDAIVTLGVDWLHGWLDEGGMPSSTCQLERRMAIFHEQFRWTMHPPACVFDVSTRRVVKFRPWSDNVSNYNIKDNMPTSSGMPSTKVIEVGKYWKDSDDRPNVQSVVYKPGDEAVDEEGLWGNTWVYDGPTPREGSIEPFMKVYRNAVQDHKQFDVFMDCMAYIVQNPGTRLEKCFFFASTKQGTGKTTLANIMADMVGKSNAIKSMTIKALRRDFNSIYACKQVIVMDEIPIITAEDWVDLKRAITAPDVMVNTKMLPEYEVGNYGHWFMTTNKLAFPMDDDERRLLPLHFDPVVWHRDGSAWWKDFFKWLESGGLEALRAHLEERDIEGFEPNFVPDLTSFKVQLTEASMDDLDTYVSSLERAPDDVLAPGRSVFSAQELLGLFDPDTFAVEAGQPLVEAVRKQIQAFSQQLKVAGVPLAGVRVKPPGSNGKKSYFIIRGRKEEWGSTELLRDIKRYAKIQLV